MRIDPPVTGSHDAPRGAAHAVEKITTGVVSIQWSNPTIPLHGRPGRFWEIGMKKKPPLHVKFDDHSAQLSGVQLVLQDEGVPAGQVFGDDLSTGTGTPVFDLSPWSEYPLYVDYHFEPVVHWESDHQIGVRVVDCGVVQVVQYNLGDFSVLLDMNSRIVGFRYLAISDDEATIIRQADTSA
jgi:hypothetical protein